MTKKNDEIRGIHRIARQLEVSPSNLWAILQMEVVPGITQRAGGWREYLLVDVEAATQYLHVDRRVEKKYRGLKGLE